jgi:type I restriction enzyme S subunit
MDQSSWHDTTLGEFVRLQRGHDLPEADRRPGDVPIMGSAGQNGFHDTAKAKGPGVVIGRSGVGSMGVVSYCDVDYWPHNTVLYVTDFLGNDPRFVFYFLRQLDLRRFDSGSVQASLNRNYIYPISIRVPGLNEQRIIAHILGTLDDKIEANRGMNETLEAMARALFKSWFVDFDPVRAKAEGRDQSLEEAIAGLFPDTFVDSEIAEMPKGWMVQSIYEIADVVYGAPFASAQFNTQRVGEPLVRIRDLSDESPSVWTPEVHAKGYKIHPGDIVVGMDGEFRAYLWGGEEAWLNQRVCVFIPKQGYSAAYVRNSIFGPLSDVEATETGTTVIHLGKGDIDRFLVVVPSPAVLAAFNQFCEKWYDRIVVAKRESRALAALRDALLPKLISGELRVKDAEKRVEALV